MLPEQNNFAYIDGANVHKGVCALGWELDYQRFRVWLSEKYKVKRAYLFIGFVPRYKYIYAYLKKAGFVLIFKETVHDGDRNIKGNCDADLVLQAVQDFYENRFDKALLVSSDGDYASLVRFLLARRKLLVVLSPRIKCSMLLKRINATISYLHDQRALLENKKAPDTDRTV